MTLSALHFATNYPGGASKASYRLHRSLVHNDVWSQMMVRQSTPDQLDVMQVERVWPHGFRRIFDRIHRWHTHLPTPEYTFNLDVNPGLNTKQFVSFPRGKIDVVYLHWVTHLLTTRDIRDICEHYRCPLVWVLMDLEPLAGGCHYPSGCERFKSRCEFCPQLSPHGKRDRASVIFDRKRHHLSDLPITFVAPAKWVAQRVKESSLFCDHRVEEIPLPVDENVFRPVRRSTARDLLHLPQHKKLVFFGAKFLDEPRKGMESLHEALKLVSAKFVGEHSRLCHQDIALLVAGERTAPWIDTLGFEHHFVGYMKDDITLALAYQAADVYVSPSLEDAGPLMIAESMLCGTPVVAFDIGGAADLVCSGVNGYLAAPRDVAGLAYGITSVLSSERPGGLSRAARQAAVARHARDRVAQEHVALVCDLLREG